MLGIPGLAEKLLVLCRITVVCTVELVVCYTLDTFLSSVNPEKHLLHFDKSSQIFTGSIIKPLLVNVLLVAEKFLSKINLGCNPE
jgi:hypothetical protein